MHIFATFETSFNKIMKYTVYEIVSKTTNSRLKLALCRYWINCFKITYIVSILDVDCLLCFRHMTTNPSSKWNGNRFFACHIHGFTKTWGKQNRQQPWVHIGQGVLLLLPSKYVDGFMSFSLDNLEESKGRRNRIKSNLFSRNFWNILGSITVNCKL